jgi:hypothetical protein
MAEIGEFLDGNHPAPLVAGGPGAGLQACRDTFK